MAVTLVDGVILSAIWGKTTEEQLLDAATQLRMNGAPLIGTVIDEVNPDVHANHGYGGLCVHGRVSPVGNLPQMSARDGTSRYDLLKVLPIFFRSVAK